MECAVIKSKLISSAAYYSDSQELCVWFHSGRSAWYKDVSRAVFRNLAEAESPGFYYEFHIRGRYPSPERRKLKLFGRFGMALAIAVVIALVPFVDNWDAAQPIAGESLTPGKLPPPQHAERA